MVSMEFISVFVLFVIVSCLLITLCVLTHGTLLLFDKKLLACLILFNPRVALYRQRTTESLECRPE